VFKMRTAKFHGFGAFHGYWVEDLGKVEPRFGTLETLRRLSDALHARKMRLVLDFVVNHVGPDAPLAREKPEWFHHHGAIKDWEDARQLTDFDVHGLPDFAQEREDVYAFLLGKAKYWIDAVRPDGFRLDAVKHVPLAFWRRFNRDVKAYAGADFWMLGEVLDGRPSVLARYMRDGEFDALFDFPVAFALKDVFCKGAHMGRLASVLSEDRVYEDPSKLVTLLDNHDLPRIASECADAERRALALEVLFQLRGTPSFTYGTEIALEGRDEASARRDMDFARKPDARLQRALASRPAQRGRRWAITDLTRSHLKWFQLPACPGFSGELYAEGPRRGIRLRSDADHCGKQGGWNTGAVQVVARGVPRADAVVLVGSGAELGDWMPERGVRMTKMADRYAATLSLASHCVHAFKLVARSASGQTWEPGDNHYVRDQFGARVEVTWGAGS